MLGPKELIELGIKPGETFGKILKQVASCASKEEAKELATQIWLKHCREKACVKQTSFKVIEGSVLEFLIKNPCFRGIASIDTPNTIASNSEKRRWLENGAVIINGDVVHPDDLMSDWGFLRSLVFFPNGKRKLTML